MDQNFATNWLVPLSKWDIPDNSSHNLKILKIFVIGPSALPQCNTGIKSNKKIFKYEIVYIYEEALKYFIVLKVGLAYKIMIIQAQI